MNELFKKLFTPFMLYVNEGGGAGDGAGGAGAGDDAGGGDVAGAGAGDGAGGKALQNLDVRSYMDEKGNFTKPEWAGEHVNLAKKFTSLGALSKSYANLERQIGNSNKVAVPSDHSTPEEWDSFYNRLGRPETAEGYELKKPESLRDDLWSEDAAKEYSTFAHKLGLTKSQATELAAWQQGRVGGEVTKHDEALAANQAESIAALKKEWGAEYATNVASAKRGANLAGGQELVDHPLANDPIFIRAMAKIGGMVKEDGTGGLRGGGVGGMGKGPADEIAAIRADPKHPYHHGSHRDHMTAVLRMGELYAAIQPKE